MFSCCQTLEMPHSSRFDQIYIYFYTTLKSSNKVIFPQGQRVNLLANLSQLVVLAKNVRIPQHLQNVYIFLFFYPNFCLTAQGGANINSVSLKFAEPTKSVNNNIGYYLYQYIEC